MASLNLIHDPDGNRKMDKHEDKWRRKKISLTKRLISNGNCDGCLKSAVSRGSPNLSAPGKQHHQRTHWPPKEHMHTLTHTHTQTRAHSPIATEEAAR